jgi:hypothetical protein
MPYTLRISVLLREHRYHSLIPLFALMMTCLIAGSSVQAATYTVDRTDDATVGACTSAANDCTLRGAIAVTNSTPDADIINFTPDLTIISLTTAELTISSDLSIQGPGAGLLKISRSSAQGTPLFRIFNVTAGSVTLADLTITNGNTNDFGGGILNRGTLTLNRCVVSDNFANSHGGLSNLQTLHVIASTIKNNRTDYGGGIGNFNTLDITESTIDGNRANVMGGGIDNAYKDARLTLVRSTISNNSADFSGGINNFSGTTTILSSTISGNSARYQSGGVANVGHSDGTTAFQATLTVVDSTITLNQSPSASGLHNSLNGGQARLTMRNSIVAGNTGSTDYLSTGASDISQYNFIGSDPRLAPLQNNGGLTLTHRPLPDSPVIDAGNSTALDQRGLPRPFEAVSATNAPGGNGADIGAVEVRIPLLDLNGSAAGVDFSTTFIEDAIPVALTSADTSVTGGEFAQLTGVTITLTNRPDGNAESLAVNVGSSGLTASAYDATTGVLTLSGSASAPTYAQVLRTLTYHNSSQRPTPLQRQATLTVSDVVYSSPLALSTITVVPVNDAPQLQDDAYDVISDSVTIPAPGVLQNDTDVEGNALTAELVDHPTLGTMTLNVDGSFSYTRRNGFSGFDTFTYRAHDGQGGSSLATVRLNVLPVDAPVLTLTITPGSFSEAAGPNAATGLVTRSGSTTSEIIVSLSSNDLNEVTVPPSITIPAGQASASFSVGAVDDSDDDEDQRAIVIASSSGLIPGSVSILITDDEVADTTPPILTWLTLTQNQILQGFPSLRVHAIEVTPPNNPFKPIVTGVATVQIQLMRENDGRYWSGRNWSRVAVSLPATLIDAPAGKTWAMTENLPSGFNLKDGKYILTATAIDRAGNSNGATVRVWIDRTAPQVLFTYPTHGATVSTLRYVSGRAVDPSGGVGSKRVQLFIKRSSDGKYWSGKNWSTTAIALNTKLEGNTWSRNGSASFSLPAGANLKYGLYYLTALATDGAGNRSVTTTAVTLASTVPVT